jgi:hypothetical protein
MSNLTVELSDAEASELTNKGLHFESVRGKNFDGDTINTILLSITSTATIKVFCDFVVHILKQRRSGKIKINGVEMSNVSEAALLKLASMQSSPGTHDAGKSG